ncbi:MAG: hypothetical protein AAFO91_20175, partial [Bacteroidota bacterium]
MATRNATQHFVPLRDIRNGVAILKNGQLNTIILASSVNFALKSVDEQEATLRAFQSFLNTLDFSIQFYIQSRRLNIKPYLEQLAAKEKDQDNDLMRIQLREYINFIRTFTNEVDVMSKNFFVIVPYTPVAANLQNNLTDMFGKGDKVYFDDKNFAEHRTQLQQRTLLVEQGLNRIGIRTARLRDEEIVELYYHIF